MSQLETDMTTDVTARAAEVLKEHRASIDRLDAILERLESVRQRVYKN